VRFSAGVNSSYLGDYLIIFSLKENVREDVPRGCDGEIVALLAHFFSVIPRLTYLPRDFGRNANMHSRPDFTENLVIKSCVACHVCAFGSFVP